MSNRLAAATRQRGVTLVELIVAMVIVGVAVAGLMAAFSSTARGSADPVIRRQMMAIADGMMEEVLLKPFEPAPSPPGVTRQDFNDIRDYDGFDRNRLTDINDDLIPALQTYRVRVEVEPAQLRQVPAGEALRIEVRVSHPGFDDVVLNGWRTRAQ